MKTIKFYCPRWGNEHLTWKDFMLKVRDAGYDGIEYGISNSTLEEELNTVWTLAEQMRLDIIPQHYETSHVDIEKHSEIFDRWFRKIKPFPVKKINSQTGRDFFSFEANLKLIQLAEYHSKVIGAGICHETHRGKFSFAAHITKEYLEAIPSLRLTLDISHWICVAETLLDDQIDTMELAVARTNHIHARVGFPEGPQITDPRLSEWNYAIEVHLKWWDKVVDHYRISNQQMTITPEFGPYPYMVHLPFTKQPITSQWEVNQYMMELLKKRYAT